MRVAEDDVLNVRSGPGAVLGGDVIVATLAPDATDVNRTGATEDNDVPPTSPTTLPPLPPPAFSTLGVEIGGIGVFADAPTSFVTVDAADISTESTTTYDWEPFPDDPSCGADCRSPVTRFLGLGELTDPAATYNTEPITYAEPNEQFLVGNSPALHRAIRDGADRDTGIVGSGQRLEDLHSRLRLPQRCPGDHRQLAVGLDTLKHSGKECSGRLTRPYGDMSASQFAVWGGKRRVQHRELRRRG